MNVPKPKIGNYLIGQAGEHIVCAELCRRGVVASSLSGNAPDIDILAYRDGKAVSLQVKTVTGGSLQGDLQRFLDIEVLADGHQQIKTKRTELNRNLLFVLVELDMSKGNDHSDRFFVFTQGDLQDLVFEHHRSYLRKHGGKRPRNPSSMHFGISVDEFVGFQDRWDLVMNRLL